MKIKFKIFELTEVSVKDNWLNEDLTVRALEEWSQEFDSELEAHLFIESMEFEQNRMLEVKKIFFK